MPERRELVGSGHWRSGRRLYLRIVKSMALSTATHDWCVGSEALSLSEFDMTAPAKHRASCRISLQRGSKSGENEIFNAVPSGPYPGSFPSPDSKPAKSGVRVNFVKHDFPHRMIAGLPSTSPAASPLTTCSPVRRRLLLVISASVVRASQRNVCPCPPKEMAIAFPGFGPNGWIEADDTGPNVSRSKPSSATSQMPFAYGCQRWVIAPRYLLGNRAVIGEGRNFDVMNLGGSRLPLLAPPPSVGA